MVTRHFSIGVVLVVGGWRGGNRLNCIKDILRIAVDGKAIELFHCPKQIVKFSQMGGGGNLTIGFIFPLLIALGIDGIESAASLRIAPHRKNDAVGANGRRGS